MRRLGLAHASTLSIRYYEQATAIVIAASIMLYVAANVMPVYRYTQKHMYPDIYVTDNGLVYIAGSDAVGGMVSCACREPSKDFEDSKPSLGTSAPASSSRRRPVYWTRRCPPGLLFHYPSHTNL